MHDDDKAKDTITRGRNLGAHLASLLVTRVDAGGGVPIRWLTFEQWTNIQKDPEYVSLQSYVKNLTEYADGRPRPQPLRPLLHNEVGMYRGAILVMKGDNPDDDGRRWIQSGFEVPASTPTKDHSDE